MGLFDSFISNDDSEAIMGSGQYLQGLAIQSAESVNRATSALYKSQTRQRFYHPELDAIRIFLFVGVWSYHALPREESYYIARHVPVALASFISGAIRAGMCSLDVFFILSAFLITELQ